MSTHNMFLWRNKKNTSTFGLKKAPYQELCIYFLSIQGCGGKLPMTVVLKYFISPCNLPLWRSCPSQDKGKILTFSLCNSTPGLNVHHLYRLKDLRFSTLIITPLIMTFEDKLYVSFSTLLSVEDSLKAYTEVFGKINGQLQHLRGLLEASGYIM